MTLDKEEHRVILMELLNVFPGQFAETVVELKQAIKGAPVGDATIITTTETSTASPL
jgi:hypothetical protein